MTAGWAALNTLRDIVLTVEECDERIADAQHVLDNPSQYPVEVRVDADKAVRRYTKLREGAAALALVQIALEAAEAVSVELQTDAKCLLCALYHEHIEDCAAPLLAAALRAVREGK